MARALEERFGEVCRTEIARMTRKTRGLSPDERRALQDLSLQVVQAIATRAGAALGQPDSEHLAPVLAELFDVKEVP
jgi:Glutamyl-tRNAGlu reductase, dimerisation domain